MKMEGRIEWKGADPDAVKLTDNGKRKAQIRLADGRFEIAVTLRDLDGFIRDLEDVRLWISQG